MFAARGIAVSLSVFVMVYCVLSLAVGLTWQRFADYARKLHICRTADSLFAFRMFPLVAAAVITAAFTIPSFLLLEPRGIDEPLGGFPLVLGLCGASLGLFGLMNAGRALHRASRTISRWTSEAERVPNAGSVPVLRIVRPLPAMTAAGIVSPRVLLSRSAESMLSSSELRTALNHEVAHIRRRDNLKKMLLRFVAFPGMNRLEEAWLEATEMAADDAAVSSEGEALDLAAALIKLSRLGPVEPAVDLTASLVHSPAGVINARIERLIAWSESRRVTSLQHSPWYGLAAAACSIAVFAISYSHLLARIHTATEWLVR